MTKYNITLDKEILHYLFSSNDKGMKMLLEQIINQILEQQRTEQINAELYERTDNRKAYRNGYKTKKLNTRVGNLILNIVSELCKRLDTVVQEWKERNLKYKRYPFLIVDALVIKIRENHRVKPYSALISTGINDKGYRELLGLEIGNSESEQSWSDFFRHLKQRGLKGVDFVISDNHPGLVKAAAISFQGSTWQRCQAHFTRNILSFCPKHLQSSLNGNLRLIFEAPDLNTAEELLKKTIETFSKTAGKAIDILEQEFYDATSILILPERYRKRLRTTNSIERLNEEIRRRERVIRIFPNRESATRLIGALLIEQDELWSTGHKYFDMDEYWQWRCKYEPNKVEPIVKEEFNIA